MYGYDILCEISKSTFEIPHKNLTHTFKDDSSIQCSKFRSSQILELVNVFEMSPWCY